MPHCMFTLSQVSFKCDTTLSALAEHVPKEAVLAVVMPGQHSIC